MASFETLSLSPELLAVLSEVGYNEMTPVQELTIPELLKGKDVLAQARTGSGKTAAFTLPLLGSLRLESRALQALILCPTRELSQQVAREIRKLGRKHKDLQVLTLTGGEPGKPQTEALRRGVHIVVGTPGRVLDHLGRGNLDFSDLNYLVLDEADRMLDMGFGEDLLAILKTTPRDKQSAFFSATFPESILSIARRFLNKPAEVRVAEEESEASTQQLIFHAEEEEKPKKLARILKLTRGSALIFMNLKASVNELVEILRRQGLPAAALHGDLEQRDRERVLAMFRNGSVRVLVATDVAARGLDIQDLDTVINYQTPHEAEVYVHRIGRTGRAGRAGTAISLASVDERQRLRGFGVNTKEADWEDLPQADEDVDPMTGMRTLFVSGGRKDKLRPGDILGALTGASGDGLEGKAVGKIEIHDRLSYVAVASSQVDKALQRLKTRGIKGRKFLIKLVE